MNLMRNLFVWGLSFSLFFVACTGTKTSGVSANKYFILKSVVLNQFISGIAGGAGGKSYVAEVEMKQVANIEFEQMIIDDMLISCKTLRTDPERIGKPIEAGETLVIEASIQSRLDDKSYKELSTEELSAIKNRGKRGALIYTIDGAKKYFPIDSVETKPTYVGR